MVCTNKDGFSHFGQLDRKRAGHGGLAHAAFAAAEDPLQRFLVDDVLQRRLHVLLGKGSATAVVFILFFYFCDPLIV
jgi:hypothetical protein